MFVGESVRLSWEMHRWRTVAKGAEGLGIQQTSGNLLTSWASSF